MLKIKKIAKKDLIPNKWDGGEIFEYFIYPEESSYINRNFNFRISSASISKTPSNFTRFSKYCRYLVMLDNSLNVERNSVNETYKKHEIFKFNSNDEIVSFSLGNDFNLMINEDVKNHQVRVCKDDCSSNANWIIIFALSENEIIINDEKYFLACNDCLIIQNFENNKVLLNSDLNTLLAEILD